MSMKISSGTIWNRTRDLPAFSAVPQLTAPPRAPTHFNTKTKTKPLYLRGKSDNDIQSSMEK